MSHPFSLTLDESPLGGHIFGTLHVGINNVWIPLHRRCCLCNHLAINLVTIDGDLVECSGLADSALASRFRSAAPSEEVDRG